MDAIDLIQRAVARRDMPPPSERRRIRLEAGVSQDDIGAVLGVNRSSVARWEAGTREPDAGHVVGYLDLLRELDKVAAA